MLDKSSGIENTVGWRLTILIVEVQDKCQGK